MSWNDFIPLLTLLTSLIPAAIISLMAEERVRARTVVNMAGATLKLVLIGIMLWGVFRERQYELRFPVLPGIDFVLRADALAMFFVTLSGLLWFLTTIYAIAYLEGSPRRRRFFGFFSLCVSATVGIALAGNLFTFVIFYELLTLSTYPLVVHRETKVSRRAGRVYLAYTLGGGGLLLAGAAWLHALVPTVDFAVGESLAGLGDEHQTPLRAIFLLLVAGMSVKAALVPLHGWLPQAMVAPAPVSALLHAVAVVKAGAFGIVRIVYDVYGIERAHALGVMLPLAVWASVTILYASVRALFQEDLKRRLAFSTVSQVSYIALGVAVLGPSSTAGGIVHLVHQGLMKITLFFCAGNLAETLGIKKISEMQGVGRRMPWTMAAFTAAALGMIGIPPICGFISKWYLGAGAIEASQYWVLAVLAGSSALNAAYFLPILHRTWFCEPQGHWADEGSSVGVETRWGLLLPPLATAVFAVAVGVMAGTPFSPLQWASLIVERNYGYPVIDRGLGEDLAALSFESSFLMLGLAVPLVAAGLLLFRPASGWMLGLASCAALPAVVLAFFLEPGTTLDLDWLLLHMHLGLDETGQTFLRFTSIAWLAAGISARGYLADDPRSGRFFFYFLLAMAGNLGLVLSLDMASFYLFFAMMSFSAYPLVIHHRDEEALRAGRIYIVLVILGEIALFAGMLLAMVAQDSLLFGPSAANLMTAPARDAAIGLILAGFAVKAGVIPLHVWLPLAHPAAPTPASAVLSGAMIKAGLLGWIRFLPVGESALAGWGNLCLSVGFATAFYGVFVGIAQKSAKAVLAYSSISQMGLIMLGLGGGLLEPAAWPAILGAMLIYTLHHGLSKACLFLSVGVAPRAGGNSWRQRLLQVGLVVPALALAGAPLTIGAVSKSALKTSLAALPAHWHAALDVLLPMSTIGTMLLMARFFYLVWPRSEPAAESRAPLEWVSWLALLVTVLTAAWLLPPAIAPEPGSSLLVKTIIWGNLWPLGLGVLIAWSAWRLGSLPGSPNLPIIPAGDILVFWQKMQQGFAGRLPSMTDQPKPHDIPSSRVQNALDRENVRRLLQSGEAMMASWPWIAVSLVILVAACCLVWFYPL